MKPSPSSTALEITAVVLIVIAVSDVLGFHSAAFLLAVIGVPVAAGVVLAALARVIDRDHGRMQVVLSAALLGAMLLGAAARSPAIAEPSVPVAATVALAGAFALVVLQGLVALGERSARA